MRKTKDIEVPLGDNEKFNRFRKVVFRELKKLGPSPRHPLNIKRAAELAGVSQNTAGKYVSILQITGDIEVVSDPPAKKLYLTKYSSSERGRRRSGTR